MQEPGLASSKAHQSRPATHILGPCRLEVVLERRVFYKTLTHRAQIAGVVNAWNDESFTSSTCCNCTNDIQAGTNRAVNSKRCGLVIDRDLLCVRNVMVRYFAEVIDPAQLPLELVLEVLMRVLEVES